MVWKYDLAELTDTASGLTTLKSDYEGATDSRKAASAAFGSDDISGAVEEFVDSWSKKRKQQIESIGNAATALQGIIDNYVQLDQNGVSGLSQSAP